MARAPNEDPERRARLYDRPTYRALVATVAANAKRLRRAKRWTQTQAAVRREMALYLYQRTEGGRQNVTLTTLARLCDGFGVGVAELFRDVPTKPE